MPDTTSNATALGPAAPRRWRWWTWFLAGFLLVFVGLSVALPTDSYDGRSVTRISLGHYYLLEIQQAWHATGRLGRMSGHAAAVVTIALQHVGMSILGGAVMTGVGWIVRKAWRPN